VDQNEIAYTQIFGRTFLEKSYNRPVRISNRVVVKPPGADYARRPEDIVLEMAPGISFGIGDHPTTRLAVRAIETAMETKGNVRGEKRHKSGLDIGTGSGILAIALALFGVESITATDIDSCSIREAQENIRINGLSLRIRLLHTETLPMGASFDFITANLRFPTLYRLRNLLYRLLEPDGYLIVSGVKTEEVDELEESFVQSGFIVRQVEREKGWAGIILKRK
jgi:ribosomal protein L11 methyltransferase